MATDEARDGEEGSEDGPILVVDDDPQMREALAHLLEHEGHRVLQASDGPTAIAMTREHAPGLVVLDDVRPTMDGEAVLDELRRELGDMPPALLLTAAIGPLARVRTMSAVTGIEKPFNVRELLAAVELHRRRVKRAAS